MDDYLNVPNINIDSVYYALGQHPTDVITLKPDTGKFCFKYYSEELVKHQANTNERCSNASAIPVAPNGISSPPLFVKGVGKELKGGDKIINWRGKFQQNTNRK